MGRQKAMKKWKWFIWAVIALLACTREERMPEGTEQPFPEGKTVTIRFSVAGSPEASTKALDNGMKIDNMYVAVFGSSGYLKQYEPASLEETGTYTYPVMQKINEEGEQKSVMRTVPLYTFSVKLALSDSPRKVHFIGNGPQNIAFGYDTAVIPKLMSGNDEKAYWQMIELPNGIRAKKVNGVFVDKDNKPIPDGGDGYVPDETTQEALQFIPMIRNWAKITLYANPVATSYFEPISFAVVNVPSSGSIAPYSGKTGFIQNYKDYGFDDLQNEGYTANLPVGATFDTSIPPAEYFENPTLSGGRVALASNLYDMEKDEDDRHSVFLYERPAPSEKIPPTYVIVYGHYTGAPEDQGNEGYYYYKVDLMETKQKGRDWESYYYPIYRNFKYHINIQQILSRGQSTPAAAAASAGSADVSTDINTSGLADISDGVGRLFLQPWMAQTFTIEHGPSNPVDELSVCFYTNGQPDLESPVKVELLDPTDGGEPVVYQVPNPEDPENPLPFLSEPSTTEGDGYGWRQIHFCTIAPGRVTRTQTMRITGTHQFGRLYRDVVISVQPLQPMWVRCGQEEISPAVDVEQSVSFGIPDGLVKSMFPLEFTIEAQDMSLTPDKEHTEINLPLLCDTSISQDEGYAGKPTFQFKRTVTWEEYLSLPVEEDEEENIWRRIDNYFRTNREQNATTVWVFNKYFRDKDSQDLTDNQPHPVSASFSNFEFKKFTDVKFSSPIPRAADKVVTFTFGALKASTGRYPQVTFKTRGLVSDDPLLSQGDELGTYVMTPTSSEKVTLSFITTTEDGDIEVELSSPEFYTEYRVPYFFNKGMPKGSYGLLDGLKVGNRYSNVAFGRVQQRKNGNNSGDARDVIFGYYSDPDDESNPAITLSDLSGTVLNTSNNNSSGLKVETNYVSFPWTAAVPKYGHYYEFFLKTIGAGENDDVSFQLSAPGYVTEIFNYGRLRKNGQTSPSQTRLHSCDVTSTLMNSNKWFNAEDQTIIPQKRDNTTDESYFKITIERLGGAPAPYMDNNSALVLGRDKESGDTPGGTYRFTFVSGYDSSIHPFNDPEEKSKDQRFFWCQFTMDSPTSITPAQGFYFNYPGEANSRKLIWYAYDDAEAAYASTQTGKAKDYPKSIEFEVSAGKSVRLNNIFYKAISYY